MRFFLCNQLNISLHDRRQLSGLDSSEFVLYELCRSAVFLVRSLLTWYMSSFTLVKTYLDISHSLLKYQWTDEEVRNATGCSNGMLAEHPLKLNSSYAMLKVLVCNFNWEHGNF